MALTARMLKVHCYQWTLHLVRHVPRRVGDPISRVQATGWEPRQGDEHDGSYVLLVRTEFAFAGHPDVVAVLMGWSLELQWKLEIMEHKA